jgi:hypothetical protein
MEVEEFESLSEVKDESAVERRSIEGRRSITVQNSLPDLNISIGIPFELTIDGNSVFTSNSSIFLDATNIPTWLISSNLNPTLVGSYNTPGYAEKVVISGNYAYIADADSGLQIIDITNPSNPTFKGSYNTPCPAFEVVLSGNYAYVASGGWPTGCSLQIIDITNPSNPIFKGAYNIPGSMYGVAVSGNYAYVVNSGLGLQIIDIRDPANPTFTGSYNVFYGRGVALSGNYAYVADDNAGLQIIDITDPSNPTFKGSYDTYRAFGIAVSGNYAYVADWSSGLQIIDIANLTNPTFEGSYDTPGEARGVALSGNYAYVADDDAGLQIIDITDPANPTLKGSYNCSPALGVTFFGNYAYVANDWRGLKIIASNFDKLILSGTPSFEGTYSINIKACNEISECITDSFNIYVRNNAPIVANLLQNQTAIVDILFNYIFPTNTFFDSDGHSLTYTAETSDNSPLPSWLNFNALQREFSGTPTTSNTYPIKVIANDGYDGSVFNTFQIHVINNSPIVTNPIQNQTAMVNALFNYIFPTNTFFDSDGHSLTYIAKSSDDTSLPNWLNSQVIR